MRPFLLEESMLPLTAPYPEPLLFMKVTKMAGHRDRHAIARLWLSEGIPFAFRECPALYEAVRGWFAHQVDVHPKEVTLIGSARIGFSLAPDSLGRAFGDRSDLDLTVISEPLFNRVRSAFEAWAHDYGHGTVNPRNDQERSYWNSNLEFGRRNIPKGFMDPNKIPLWDRYPIAQRVLHSCWLLREKLLRTEGGPAVREASVRVYRDWYAFIRQLTLNLKHALG